MTDGNEFESARARCRDGIAERQVQLSEVASNVKQAQNQAMASMGALLRGDITEREKDAAFAAVLDAETRERVLRMEIAGLEQELARINAAELEANRQRAFDASAEYALKAIAAAHALDAHLVPGVANAASSPLAFGPAIRDLIRNQNAAAEYWPDKLAQRRPDKIAPSAFGGELSATRLQQFVAHLWALLCVATDESLPYQVGPAVAPLAGSGAAYLAGMARHQVSPKFADMFCGGWPSFFDEAGRKDLADRMRAAFAPKATPSKGRKAA
jgi:hypothetical protein